MSNFIDDLTPTYVTADTNMLTLYRATGTVVITATITPDGRQTISAERHYPSNDKYAYNEE